MQGPPDNLVSNLEYFPLPDSEPRLTRDTHHEDKDMLFLWCLAKIKGVKFESCFKNITSEGRPAYVAIINYNYLNEPALYILRDEDTSHVGVSYKKKTALHHAAVSCKPEFILKLVEHNADPTLTDDDGRTPLHYILDYCDVRVIETLKLKLETDEHSNDDEPFCDVPLNVMKLVDELHNNSISIHNIIASAKILIKCSMLWDAVIYKNWCKMQKVKLLPEVLNYLKSCISEVQSMKAKKIENNLQLYTLVTGKCNSYDCSPFSARVIIRHMVNVSNERVSYHADVAKKIDRLSMENHLVECMIYAGSECGKKKIFLNPECISSLCKNLANADLLSLIIAVSI
ncbi:hypothetical protein TNIN_383751 [Trichonephila inaurata madagascariensis]|uniref:Ankyrin repeat protein n=1 Tax=Trichonephila inaurata madagascariensis TaxID=2747483 RepID=A0A8X7CGP4_9ARAC|nr:hypothetical protein TNIN_383751 [Trichonephila inaurata madagascariensis]